MTEPMTDAEVDALKRRYELGIVVAEDGTRFLTGVRIYNAEWYRLLARLDAERSRADAAEAARDAALARAMPEPVLVRTAAEVGALTTGAYRIAAPWRPREWLLGHRYPTRSWTLLIGMHASGVMDDDIVGSWVQRLPDLPIPTPGDAHHGCNRRRHARRHALLVLRHLPGRRELWLSHHMCSVRR